MKEKLAALSEEHVKEKNQFDAKTEQLEKKLMSIEVTVQSDFI